MSPSSEEIVWKLPSQPDVPPPAADPESVEWARRRLVRAYGPSRVHRGSRSLPSPIFVRFPNRTMARVARRAVKRLIGSGALPPCRIVGVVEEEEGG